MFCKYLGGYISYPVYPRCDFFFSACAIRVEHSLAFIEEVVEPNFPEYPTFTPLVLWF